MSMNNQHIWDKRIPIDNTVSQYNIRKKEALKWNH